MEFYGNAEDLPEAIRDIMAKLGVRGAAVREEAPADKAPAIDAVKDSYSASWREVLDQQKALDIFHLIGKRLGKHDNECPYAFCKIGHPASASYASYDRFMAGMAALPKMTKQLSDPESIEALMVNWRDRPVQEVLEDPRFKAFQTSYDWQMLKAGALRNLIRAPQL